jgi:hypothetical protein
MHSFPTATMGLHTRNQAGRNHLFLGEIDELLLIWVESYAHIRGKATFNHA